MKEPIPTMGSCCDATARTLGDRRIIRRRSGQGIVASRALCVMRSRRSGKVRRVLHSHLWRTQKLGKTPSLFPLDDRKSKRPSQASPFENPFIDSPLATSRRNRKRPQLQRDWSLSHWKEIIPHRVTKRRRQTTKVERRISPHIPRGSLPPGAEESAAGSWSGGLGNNAYTPQGSRY